MNRIVTTIRDANASALRHRNGDHVATTTASTPPLVGLHWRVSANGIPHGTAWR
jgi:hypothetical protein